MEGNIIWTFLNELEFYLPLGATNNKKKQTNESPFHLKRLVVNFSQLTAWCRCFASFCRHPTIVHSSRAVRCKNIMEMEMNCSEMQLIKITIILSKEQTNRCTYWTICIVRYTYMYLWTVRWVESLIYQSANGLSLASLHRGVTNLAAVYYGYLRLHVDSWLKYRPNSTWLTMTLRENSWVVSRKHQQHVTAVVM